MVERRRAWAATAERVGHERRRRRDERVDLGRVVFRYEWRELRVETAV